MIKATVHRRKIRLVGVQIQGLAQSNYFFDDLLFLSNLQQDCMLFALNVAVISFQKGNTKIFLREATPMSLITNECNRSPYREDGSARLMMRIDKLSLKWPSLRLRQREKVTWLAEQAERLRSPLNDDQGQIWFLLLGLASQLEHSKER